MADSIRIPLKITTELTVEAIAAQNKTPRRLAFGSVILYFLVAWLYVWEETVRRG